MAMSKYASRVDHVGSALKGAPRRGVPVVDRDVTGAGPSAKGKFDAVIAAAVAAAPRLTPAQVDELAELLRPAAMNGTSRPGPGTKLSTTASALPRAHDHQLHQEGQMATRFTAAPSKRPYARTRGRDGVQTHD